MAVVVDWLFFGNPIHRYMSKISLDGLLMTIFFYNDTGLKWRLTGFYRQLDTSRREETWTLLESLKHSNNLPWLCLKDYNEIIS